MGHSTRDERDGLYADATEAWGTPAQLAKAAEEFAELAAAVNRWQNDQATPNDVLEEMADARLMLEQLEMYYTDDAVTDEFQQKVDALEERLRDAGDPNA